jgi:hypothetical protein
MTRSHPRWTQIALLAALTAVSTASFGASDAGASPSPAGTTVQAHSTVATDRAQVVQSMTQQRLEGRRRHLARCLARHPSLCVRWQTSVEKTEHRLSVAQTRLADMRSAPLVTLSGQTLSWAPVTGADAYVLKSRSPNLHQSHLIVFGTSVTLPAVPGETVEYFVRTAARESAWSPAVTVTYPAATPPSGEPG